MERRQLLKVGLGLGATVVCDQIATEEAEARPLKVGRQFFEGTIQTELSYYSARLRLAVVSKRVIGFASSYRNTEDRTALLMVNGTVKGNKLAAKVLVVFDPLDRVPPKTEVGTIKGVLRGAKVKGLLAIPGLPDSQGRTTGRFEAAKVKEDKAAMREVAGVYDGEVVSGQPGFKAEAILGANGTYTLSSIRRPDGTSVPGRLGGVFLLGPPLYEGEEERLVYALPLPHQDAVASLSALAGASWCDCCKETAEDREKARKEQAAAAATWWKGLGDNRFEVYSPSQSPGGGFAITATPRG